MFRPRACLCQEATRAPRVVQEEAPVSMMDFIRVRDQETPPAEEEKGLTVQEMKDVCEERVTEPRENRPAQIAPTPPRWLLNGQGILEEINPPEKPYWVLQEPTWVSKFDWTDHATTAGFAKEEGRKGHSSLFWDD